MICSFHDLDHRTPSKRFDVKFLQRIWIAQWIPFDVNVSFLSMVRRFDYVPRTEAVYVNV